jgi:uncharacterized Zn finger protein
MSFEYRPYVSAAERRRMGAKAAASHTKRTGRAPAPIQIKGRAIATTFWGSAWCKHLEAYSDYANRLPRGRTYARNGSVIDLHITTGQVEALVQGSSLYKIQITFSTLAAARWAAFKKRSAGRVTNLIDLLQGRLSKEILADLTHRDTGLFPAPSEIKMKCSCPDWAGMCKHLAAVLYGVGARLDEKPELFFTLRGVEVSELIASATATAALGTVGDGGSAADTALEGEDLSALFGVELDPGSPVAALKSAGSVNDTAPAKTSAIRRSSGPGSLVKAPRTTKRPASSKAPRTSAKPGIAGIAKSQKGATVRRKAGTPTGGRKRSDGQGDPQSPDRARNRGGGR